MQVRYKVGEIMVEKVVVASPNESIYNCARKMKIRHVSCVIVIEGEKVVGILTEQDISRKVVAEGHIPKSTPVSIIMSTNITSIDPKEDIQEVAVLMGKNEIKHLPVIENGKLLGIITAKDIIAIEPLLIEMIKFNHNNFNIYESNPKL